MLHLVCLMVLNFLTLLWLVDQSEGEIGVGVEGMIPKMEKYDEAFKQTVSSRTYKRQVRNSKDEVMHRESGLEDE